MRKRELLFPFILMASSIHAAENDETALSRYEIFDSDSQPITLEDLEAMEDEYEALLDASDCTGALPKIVAFAETANRVSNLIRRGNEPYYDARRDDQKVIARDRALLNQLVAAENATNNLVAKRNAAWVEEAKCLILEGELNAGINRLYRALDYIEPDDRELWEEARTLLWDQVGFEPQN